MPYLKQNLCKIFKYSCLLYFIIGCQSLYSKDFQIKSIPKKPELFVSSEWSFGIIFPNVKPQKIGGNYAQGNAARFQALLTNNKDKFFVYSVTATLNSKLKESDSIDKILNATADVTLLVSKNKEFSKTKKFSKFGSYDCLLFDSTYDYDGIKLPKKTMLIVNMSKKIVYDISIVGMNRDDVNKKLIDFASTFIIVET